MDPIPYLIIGNSAAALAGVQGIRSVDRETPITAVSKSRDPNHSVPLLPYWLKGRTSDERMSRVAGDYYEKHGVETRHGVEIVRVDTGQRAAIAVDGTALPFEKALIAVGGYPFVPTELDLFHIEGMSTFTTWDDARRVKAWAERPETRKAVIVGGGFIGVEVAEVLDLMGLDVMIVERGDHILNVALDDRASSIVQRAFEREGVTIRCAMAVESVHHERGRVTGVSLADGTSQPCDMLIVAIGVRANTALVADTDIKTNRGICVDEHLQTSVPGIYAAGDVAEGLERLSRTERPIALLTTARQQGFVAGCNMAGQERSLDGTVAVNSVSICGLPCITAGLATLDDEGCEIVVDEDAERSIYKKLVVQRNKLVACTMVGDTDRMGIATHLIREGIDVSACKRHLLSEDFTLDLLPPAYWQSCTNALGRPGGIGQTTTVGNHQGAAS